MEGDLSARVPVRGTHDEIDQLVTSLNDMLARIQQLMDGLAEAAQSYRGQGIVYMRALLRSHLPVELSKYLLCKLPEPPYLFPMRLT